MEEEILSVITQLRDVEGVVIRRKGYPDKLIIPREGYVVLDPEGIYKESIDPRRISRIIDDKLGSIFRANSMMVILRNEVFFLYESFFTQNKDLALGYAMGSNGILVKLSNYYQWSVIKHG